MMPVLENSHVFVLDNGGGTLKAGHSNMHAPRVVPNCITKAKSEKRRAFVGDQMDDCRDLSSLFYILPFQKGYLVNWDHQKTVWDYLFGSSCFKMDHQLSGIDLIFTEPYFNFNSIKEGLSELLFEEYGFKSIFRTNPADLSCYKNKTEFPEERCCLVVDSGYSFTHIVPYIDGRRVKEAIVRIGDVVMLNFDSVHISFVRSKRSMEKNCETLLQNSFYFDDIFWHEKFQFQNYNFGNLFSLIDIGGKLLTNHLKEIISYRQIHVLDETYVMNACKEDSCFVSLDYKKDMNQSNAEAKINPRRHPDFQYQISRDYVLPDFTSIRRGYLKPADQTGKKPKEDDCTVEQTIRLNNERFAVPELLFSPSDVGISQTGIPEAIGNVQLGIN